MTTRERRNRIRSLEGQSVCVALADGTRLDDCQLVSACRHGTRTLWLYANGADRFVALDMIVDIWESAAPRARAS
ncbi:MAG TPA: hypothetical protein VIL48_09840 [Acidimicrobiales bacterium]